MEAKAHTLGEMAASLNRSPLYVSSLQKRFELPVFSGAAYSPAYLAFLRGRVFGEGLSRCLVAVNHNSKQASLDPAQLEHIRADVRADLKSIGRSHIPVELINLVGQAEHRESLAGFHSLDDKEHFHSCRVHWFSYPATHSGRRVERAHTILLSSKKSSLQNPVEFS